jgi:hypothetical protein
VAAVGLEGSARRVAQSPGPHRLAVRFAAGSLAVTCDDAVLWANLRRPGGPLRRVSLRCLGVEGLRGAVAWADFSLERAVAERRRPPGDPGQDEVWLADGDQLFGRIVRADAQAVELRAGGTSRFGWGELRGCYFQHSAPAKGARPAVRVGLRSALAAEADVLEGSITRLDGRRLTLRHALLGEVELDRRWVRWVGPTGGR